jgi:hypothetical protein
VDIAQVDPSTFAVSIFPVGTVAVSGADVMIDFAIGSRARLSGTVAMKSLPPQSNIAAFDSSAMPPTGFNCVNRIGASGYGSVDQATGAYGLRLLTGYSYSVIGTYPIYAADPPQSAGYWVSVDPVPVDLQEDTIRDEVISPPTETIVISGQVSAATDAGLNVGLGCFLEALGAPPPGTGPIAPQSTGFSRSTQTDAGGNYRLVVPRGLIYTMRVSGPAPMP